VSRFYVFKGTEKTEETVSQEERSERRTNGGYAVRLVGARSAPTAVM